MIDKLIKLSPVPVNFVDTIQHAGNYCYDSGKYEKDAHINVYTEQKEYKKIGTLAHEISHAMCDADNCGCIKSLREEREIHAYVFELNWLLKHKQKEALEHVIHKLTNFTEGNDYYAEAAKHIMKLKLWKKCLKFVGE